MHYSWGKQLENLPEEMTEIWSCKKEGCNGWMRAGFSFKDVPVCAQCQSAMVSSRKSLPILFTSGDDVKRHQKEQRANK